MLIGICTNLTKKPTKPIIINPIPVANAILLNSIYNINRIMLVKIRKNNKNYIDLKYKINELISKFKYYT